LTQRSHTPAGLRRISSPRVIREAPYRQQHPCKHYSQGCPGCKLGVYDIERSRSWKQNATVETLRRIGGVTGFQINPIIKSPLDWGYRDRVELHIGSVGFNALGYIRQQAVKTLIPIQNCLLARDNVREAIKTLADTVPQCHLKAFDTRLLLRDNGRNGVVVSLTLPRIELCHLEVFSNWLENSEVSGWQIQGSKWCRDEVVDSDILAMNGNCSITRLVGAVPIALAPKVFTQTNRYLDSILVRMVLAEIPEKADLLDLYGGYGAFGLAHAQRGGYATIIDSNQLAITAGADFAAQHNLPVKLIQHDLNMPIPQAYLADYPYVIVDPPYTGLPLPLSVLLDNSGTAEKLIYVSCHPGSLSRDLKRLSHWRVTQVTSLDMFPQTADVETIVVLEKRTN